MPRRISDRRALRQRCARLTAVTATLTALVACGDGGSTGLGTGAGRLAITISGLPAGVSAAVTITGPDGFQFVTGSSRQLAALDPGSYTITAADVTAGGVRYTATPATQAVLVAAGALATATPITYAISSVQFDLAVELVAEGLTAPVFLSAPDGDARQFVVERNGRIRIIKNGSVLDAPFLDIRSRVNFAGERGMLSMAFDPAYHVNGRFYVYYVDLTGGMVVERFSSTPGSDVAGVSVGTVIAFPHGGENHHGGLIAFGPDGMLFVAPGDGGCCGDPQNNAQNSATLLGKVLRIDVRTAPYVVPPDNPFVNRPGTPPEIWALGLRNPWRFSFDAQTEMLYIGDVGQDTREEINIASASAGGLNYGWRLMEGTACYNPTSSCNPGGQLVLPAHEYPHSEGCSVTGGYVYRGTAIPELAGHYVYADYCRGWLRSFRATSGGIANEHQFWPGVSLPGTVSFGRDGGGELYMIAGTRVWRIVRRALASTP